MTFVKRQQNNVEPGRFGFEVLAGANEGLAHLMFAQGRLADHDRGGVHHHAGDEVIRVVSGRVLFLVGEERKLCEAGDLVVIPPMVQHGFVVESEAVIEVIAEQAMGSFYTVLSPDGSTRTLEVFRYDVPWDRQPPAGQPFTTPEQMVAIDQDVATKI